MYRIWLKSEQMVANLWTTTRVVINTSLLRTDEGTVYRLVDVRVGRGGDTRMEPSG